MNASPVPVVIPWSYFHAVLLVGKGVAFPLSGTMLLFDPSNRNENMAEDGFTFAQVAKCPKCQMLKPIPPVDDWNYHS